MPYVRIVNKHLHKEYKKLAAEYDLYLEDLVKEVLQVALDDGNAKKIAKELPEKEEAEEEVDEEEEKVEAEEKKVKEEEEAAEKEVKD